MWRDTHSRARAWAHLLPTTVVCSIDCCGRDGLPKRPDDLRYATRSECPQHTSTRELGLLHFYVSALADIFHVFVNVLVGCSSRRIVLKHTKQLGVVEVLCM